MSTFPLRPLPGVWLSPDHRFGRPCLDGTSMPTAMLASRFRAGDSIAYLARDYGFTVEQVEAALRYELLPEKRKRALFKESHAEAERRWSERFAAGWPAT